MDRSKKKLGDAVPGLSQEVQTQVIQSRNFHTELRLLESFPSSYLITRRQSHFGIIIRVELTPPLFQDVPVHEDSIVFEVHLDDGFPMQAPVVSCLTHFTSPTLADGRDLLVDVIRSEWSPEESVYEIVSELPRFVKHCVTEVSPVALSVDIGTFHLGRSMSLSQWSGKNTIGYFSCTELVPDKKQELQRAVVITETVLLTLEPSSTYIGTGRLLSWATLQSLANIKRSKLNPRRVTFVWKQIKDCPEYSQTFHMEDASACINLITSNMSHLGVLVKRQNAIIEGTLKEEDVTKRGLKDIHINDVLQAISVYEANINEKLTVEMVTSLMGLYQKAIEYFSGVGDPRYDEFLDRLHGMLSNEQIQVLLSEDATGVKPPETPVVLKSQELNGDLVLETPEIRTLSESVPKDPPPPPEESKEAVVESTIVTTVETVIPAVPTETVVPSTDVPTTAMDLKTSAEDEDTEKPGKDAEQKEVEASIPAPESQPILAEEAEEKINRGDEERKGEDLPSEDKRESA